MNTLIRAIIVLIFLTAISFVLWNTWWGLFITDKQSGLVLIWWIVSSFVVAFAAFISIFVLTDELQ